MSSATAPTALVIAAPGTNRDLDVREALELAGARVVRKTMPALDDASLESAQILVLAGGFSHADALGSGTVWASDLEHTVGDALRRFVADGKLVLGICNGFQALVRSGLLPGSLAPNASGSFVCRWVTLEATKNRTAWTEGLGRVECPVAHGEGRYVADDGTVGAHAALRYADATNPNGSASDTAGVTDATGRVLGLMPHPENHIHATQHPRHHRRDDTSARADSLGLVLFRNGVRHVRAL